MKDAMPGHYPFDGDYSYTLVQDNLSASSKHKLRHRREKGRPSMLFFLIKLKCSLYMNFNIYTDYSDSDSDWSSMERREPLYNSSNDTFSKLSRRSATQKRPKKKRTAIPVATPKVPSFNISSNGCSMNFNSLSGQLGSFYSEEASSEIKNGMYNLVFFYKYLQIVFIKLFYQLITYQHPTINPIQIHQLIILMKNLMFGSIPQLE